MLQEKNKWNHGHCHCLRTQVHDPAFLSSPSHHMYHHTASDQVTSLAENSLYKIVIHFQPHQLPETSRKWAALFLASLVLGYKAPWTNLLLSCKNTRKDHDSSDLDKDKLLWNCTPEMKFLIAAKLTKWLAATGRSSSIQVCPNWHCYSINYSITTHFLWWGLFSSSSAHHGHQKSGNAWPRRRVRSRMTSLFFHWQTARVVWLHCKAALHKQFPSNAHICSCTIRVPAPSHTALWRTESRT